MAIDDILLNIERTTIEIKKKYPKGTHRVRLANAESLTSYNVDKDDIIKWHITYLENLKNQL